MNVLIKHSVLDPKSKCCMAVASMAHRVFQEWVQTHTEDQIAYRFGLVGLDMIKAHSDPLPASLEAHR